MITATRYTIPPREEQPYSLFIEGFQNHMIRHHLSPNTIHVYTFAVEQFYDLYRELTFSNLQLYKLYLLEHYKPQTVNLRIRALNSYLEYMEQSSEKILMVKVQQKTYLENVISEADYAYLKSCLKRDGEMLYYFVIRFMAATGARVSELVEFEVEDVRRGQKDIHSKGDKIRRLYVPKALQIDALRWLYREERIDGYVFLNRFGEKISPAGIRGQLKKFAAQYGLRPEVVYPHSFRHRFAKSFIERSGDISLLADLLGHESIETTRIYLRRSSTEQKQIINQVVDW